MGSVKSKEQEPWIHWIDSHNLWRTFLSIVGQSSSTVGFESLDWCLMVSPPILTSFVCWLASNTILIHLVCNKILIFSPQNISSWGGTSITGDTHGECAGFCSDGAQWRVACNCLGHQVNFPSIFLVGAMMKKRGEYDNFPVNWVFTRFVPDLTDIPAFAELATAEGLGPEAVLFSF